MFRPAVLLLALTGCRWSGDVDSLLGFWSGALDCSAEVDDNGQMVTLDYVTAVSIDLTEQDVKVYTGQMDTSSSYIWQGREVQQDGVFAVTVVQGRSAGEQPVVIRDADCQDAALYVDSALQDEGCDAVPTSPPSGDMRWDGADTFTISGQLCQGTLSR